MRVYFTCSTAEYKKYRASYYYIRDCLVTNGHTLTRDWLQDADERIKHGDNGLNDVKQIYRACVAAIKAADLVIIEDTVSNFSTGHQITLALRMRKPTLVLWYGKHRQFQHMFIHGIESDILQVSEYTLENVGTLLRVFINKFSNTAAENRFHLVLDGVERNYLDWMHYNIGKSRTRVIRDALRNVIDNDQSYQNYLLRKS